MEKKVNEPYSSTVKSKPIPEGIIFRLAETKDINEIAELMYLRNPTMCFDKILETTKREVSFNQTPERYRIFVADLNSEVVGLCRYYHSDGIKKNKPFDAPRGYWCMGILVKPDMRRRNIAHFLSDNRFEWMKNEGIKITYSGVAGDNPASLKMHEVFGYKKVREGSGFHHISFDCGYGVLFKKELN